MPKPWEKYGGSSGQSSGPWAKYGGQQQTPQQQGSPFIQDIAGMARSALASNPLTRNFAPLAEMTVGAGMETGQAIVEDPVNAARAPARGTFVAGSWLDEANAATNAALDPYLGSFGEMLGGERIPGNTFSERYQNELATQRGMDRQFDERYPRASTTLQLGGGAATGAAALKGAPTLAQKAFGILGPNATRGERIVSGMRSGGSIGYLHGLGQGEGNIYERQESAIPMGITGAFAGGLGGALQGGPQRAAVPSNEQLHDDASRLFQQADESGVVVRGDRFTSVIDRSRSLLPKSEIARRNLTPEAQDIVDMMDELSAGGRNVSITDLNDLREMANLAVSKAARSGTPKSTMFAMQVKDELDNFIFGLDDANAGPQLKEAVNLWARMRKSELIDHTVEVASRRATAQNGNINAALKNEFNNLINRKNGLRGFSAAEREAIHKVANQGILRGGLAALGVLKPRGLVGATEIMVALNNPDIFLETAGVAAVGQGAQWGANRMAQNAANRAGDLVRSGGIETLPSVTQSPFVTQGMYRGAAPTAQQEVLRRWNVGR